MERRKFTREYKLEAVKLIKERGVARDRRPRKTWVCTRQLLRSWVKAYGDDPQSMPFPAMVS